MGGLLLKSQYPLEARKDRILHVVLKRNVFVLVTGVILY